MSTVKYRKCDKCGRLIEESEDYFRLTRVNFIGVPVRPPESFDICIACADTMIDKEVEP